jgi:hypothetical protein
MEEDLRARLLAAVGVSALVGTRVDWSERPQGDALPSITLHMISPGRGYHHGGAQDLADTRVQVDCWGAELEDAHAVAAAVIPILEPKATQGSTIFSNSFLDGARDFDPESLPGGVTGYRRSLDFIVWWQPAP